jgi:DNA-directed RNA polymerase specialized sigma24 family protein
VDSLGSVTRLIHDLRHDDPAVRDRAARLVWERYSRDLLALARHHLSRRIRRREDEHDVLQSMFRSFCRRQQRGDYILDGRDDLWGLLVTITLCKARSVGLRHRCQRRDVGREQDAPSSTVGGAPEAQLWALEQMEAVEPTPAEAALLNEALERRLRRLADPELRQLALGKLEGYTNAELAALYGCTERTIERKLERIRAKWEAAPEDGP